MNPELRKVQLCQLDLVLEVKRICEKYNINYFLIGGTLLGAVRHKGFIPWDDDLDIGMLREDYNRFVEICTNELDKDYFLQTSQTDEDYGFGFAKLKINGTIFLEYVSKDNESHKGIFIDIFPFDRMPLKKKQQVWQQKQVKLYRNLLLIKCNYNYWNKKDIKVKILRKIISFLIFPINKGYFLKKIVKNEIKYNQEKCENFINLEGAYGYKEFISVNSIQQFESAEFEGYEFSIPTNPEIYLKNLYGDFMKLPPIETRGNRHGMLKVDFGEYSVRNKYKIR